MLTCGLKIDGTESTPRNHSYDISDSLMSITYRLQNVHRPALQHVHPAIRCPTELQLLVAK